MTLLRAEIGADPGSIPGFGDVSHFFSFCFSLHLLILVPLARQGPDDWAEPTVSMRTRNGHGGGAGYIAWYRADDVRYRRKLGLGPSQLHGDGAD